MTETREQRRCRTSSRSRANTNAPSASTRTSAAPMPCPATSATRPPPPWSTACASSSPSTNQRCFTWTGPFGGGKSLAGRGAWRARCIPTRACERRPATPCAWTPSPPSTRPSRSARDGSSSRSWAGAEASSPSLHAALRKRKGKSVRRPQQAHRPDRSSPSCSMRPRDRPHDGVLVIIDEMGKFLEASALGSGDDVYFFQELAEAAARAEGRLVVVGVLHQSFAQYSARLGHRHPRRLGQGPRPLRRPCPSSQRATKSSNSSAARSRPRSARRGCATPPRPSPRRSARAGPQSGRTSPTPWSACWPLHPAMAALLGPISKRQFGQNERSTFGFLSSVEPHGFRSYLNSTLAERSDLVSPERLLGLPARELGAGDPRLARRASLVASRGSGRAGRGQDGRRLARGDDQEHRRHRPVPQRLGPGGRSRQ